MEYEIEKQSLGIQKMRSQITTLQRLVPKIRSSIEKLTTQIKAPNKERQQGKLSEKSQAMGGEK